MKEKICCIVVWAKDPTTPDAFVDIRNARHTHNGKTFIWKMPFMVMHVPVKLFEILWEYRCMIDKKWGDFVLRPLGVDSEDTRIELFVMEKNNVNKEVSA